MTKIDVKYIALLMVITAENEAQLAYALSLGHSNTSSFKIKRQCSMFRRLIEDDGKESENSACGLNVAN